MISWNERNFTPFYILSNVRRLLDRDRFWQLQPNWRIARDVFAVGSARAICRESGIDPESCEIRGRARLESDSRNPA